MTPDGLWRGAVGGGSSVPLSPPVELRVDLLDGAGDRVRLARALAPEGGPGSGAPGRRSGGRWYRRATQGEAPMTGPRSAELRALTELYRAVFRDAPGPLSDTAWLAHGFILGVLLARTDAAAAQRYVAAVLADAQAMTGTAAAVLEAEYRREADELARRAAPDQAPD
jgi:hypothetical protein